MKRKIAIVLLNYNSSSECARCVPFLKWQVDVEQEIIIVDNGSQAEEVESLRDLCKMTGCTLLENGRNAGYSAGNNVGLRYAAQKGYQYALIANPDMEFPQTDYITRLIETMEHDENIVVCGSDIRTPAGVHQNPKAALKRDWRSSFWWVKAMLRRKKGGEVPDWVGDPYTSHLCQCLNGCCLLLRMSFIRQIGFFDEHTFLYGEEPILGRQVELAEKKMYYCGDVYAVHDHKKSKEGSAAFCQKHWRHSQLYYIKRYSGYSFWGKCIAFCSTTLYFFLLSLKNK